MTIASLAVTVISTAVGMMAQGQAQKAQEKSAKAAAAYNAQVAENEAATQRELARAEREKGAADAERQRRMAVRRMGEMRSNLAASGFETDSGSALSLLGESAAEEQYDVDVIRRDADMAAWQREAAAAGADNERNFALWQGSRAGGASGMAGTLLGGIAAGLGQYNGYARTAAKKTDGMQNALNLGYKALGVARAGGY
ncbi:MAG: hypothetical protein LBU06_05735 [Desulfovibrio sp.]|nr:hypothetical protein [Desulfovibrio sp.]